MTRALLTRRLVFPAAALASALLACSGGDARNDAGVDSDAGPIACTDGVCGRFGQCVEEQNVARCVCLTGYQGAKCTDCQVGGQDRNGDGICEPACSAAACPERANCDDSTGTIVCRCQPGYVLSGLQCVPDGTIPVPSGRTVEPGLQ